MMHERISVGVGSGKGDDPYNAGKEAAEKALKDMSGKPDLTILFSSVKYDTQKVLNAVRAVTGETPLVGCSTAGEITSDGPQTESVAVMMLKSGKLKFTPALTGNLCINPKEAGRNIALNALKNSGRRELSALTLIKKGGEDRVIKINPYSFMIFPDGLCGNNGDIVKGVSDILSPTFQIVGGCAGDDFNYSKTYQFLNDGVYCDSISGVMIHSHLLTGVGARHGWVKSSKTMIVSKSKNHVVFEIDGKPAIEVYRDYFGREPAFNDMVNHPIGLITPDGGNYKIRRPVAVDGDSVVFNGDVNENNAVCMMKGDYDASLEAGRRAVKDAIQMIDNTEIATAIIFDGSARRRLFGKDVGKEIGVVKKALGDDVPIVGFYSYGEQATALNGSAEFYNKAIVVYLISKETMTEGALRFK